MVPPTLPIKLWLRNHSFTFLTSSLEPPADDASYYARIIFANHRPSDFFKIIVKLYLQAFWQNLENAKIWFLFTMFTRPLKIFFSKTTEQKFFVILHTNSTWVCVIQVCSDGYNNVKLYNIKALGCLTIES